MSIKLTAKDEIDNNLSFEDWARAKYNEIAKQINPCDENGHLDPQRLNEVLMNFSQHFAWTITIQEVEANKLSIMTHEHDIWYKENYNAALRNLREESAGAGRIPSQITIESRIVQLVGPELDRRLKAVENQKSRVDLLKGFVKVLDKQASILQTLSSNMRSELFFAAGMSFEGVQPQDKKIAAAKLLVHQAMRGQNAEGS